MKRIFHKVLKNYDNHPLRNNLTLAQMTPIIISDIDGVLMRGSTPIVGVSSAIKKLKQLKVPLACLTNGGGQTEGHKVNKMNEAFGEQLFCRDLMFMNHSPLKPQLIQSSQSCGPQKILLVTGSKDIKSILKQLNINNYITADQLFMLVNPQLEYSGIEFTNQQDFNQLSFHQYAINCKQATHEVCKRFQISQKVLPETYKYWAQKIHAIFAINDVSPYQTTLQCIHNVFLDCQNNHRKLPHYFAAQNDIVWASSYNRPRMAFGPFNRILDIHCKLHKFPFDFTYYGKPTLRAFKFVQIEMKRRFDRGVIFFMVGDNPHADIRGANNIGWESFLTQTGIHQSNQNDLQDPATFVVKDFPEAVELVQELVFMMKSTNNQNN